jgi:RimJ/RimL family protein N-acetyltransferase/glycosyltransferase involved in cell wall biosynthesis
MHAVLIRPLRKEDAKTSFHWRNDPEVWALTGGKPDRFITEEIEAEWVTKVLSQSNAKRFAILVDNVYVGNIQLTDITKNDAEYHIFIGDKGYWGKGVAARASEQILRYAKNDLGLDSVHLEVRNEHRRALSLYKKLGFKSEEVSDETVKMRIDLSHLHPPLVSVFSMVYNHEPFLKDFLEGLLCQKCDFDFEIVIGEDCSKDGSREILRDIKNKFPGKFILLLNKKNIGAVKNQNLVLSKCTGKYIALCEGDDYWTNLFKLQKQIDILDNVPEVQVVYHRVEAIGSKVRALKQRQNETGYFSLIDSLQGKQGVTLSMVFRRSAIQKINLTKYFDGLSIGDWPLECLCMIQGKGYYIDKTMGCYRMEGLGVSQHLNRTTYLDVRQKVAERLLILDISDHNKRIIRSFLNRILLLRLYHNFVTASWTKFGEDISQLFRKFSLNAILTTGVDWKRHFRISQILLKYPLGFVLGVKNMLMKKLSRL